MQPSLSSPPANHRCLSREQLQRLALGQLAPLELERASAQVESCERCQAALAGLDTASDNLLDTLRRHVDEPLDATSEQLDELMDAAEQAGLESLSAARDVRDKAIGEPQMIGPYLLVEPLSTGGMGTVYRALHTRLKRAAAVKILAGHRPSDPGAVARFRREMEAIGRLEHPHIVRAFDAGEADGQHFLAMELLDGVDAAQLVRMRGSLTIADACEIVRQAAIGIDHAHRQGLLHRDVKPSNLMLTPDGLVKVLDLGLARFSAPRDDDDGGTLTSDGHVLGTGDFVAPEQGLDPRAADERSDVYSLGCTLYYLLTGEGPFAGAGRNTFAKKVMAHVQTPPPSVREKRSDVSVALDAVLSRALEKKPDDRFASAADFAAALVPLCSGQQLAGLATRELLPSVPTASAIVHGEAQSAWLPPSAPVARGRARWLSIASAAVLGGMLGAGAILAALPWLVPQLKSSSVESEFTRELGVAGEVQRAIRPRGESTAEIHSAQSHQPPIAPTGEADDEAAPAKAEIFPRSDKPLALGWKFEEHAAAKHMPTALLVRGQGFGYLSGVQGKFHGWADKARIDIGENNVWGATGAGVEFKVDVKARAIAVETRDVEPLAIGVNAVRWTWASDSLRLLHKDEGICVVTGIQGGLVKPDHFAGLRIDDEGYYRLSGSTDDKHVVFEVTTVQLSNKRSLHAEVREHMWHSGAEPTKLIHRDEGIAFLSMLGGEWNTPEDRARVYLGEDDCWYLEGGTDAATPVFAHAMSVRFFGQPVK